MVAADGAAPVTGRAADVMQVRSMHSRRRSMHSRRHVGMLERRWISSMGRGALSAGHDG